MEFRPRNYSAEEKSYALPRSRSDNHPLLALSSPSHLQIIAIGRGNDDFFDPLRAVDDNGAISVDVSESSESNSTVELSNDASLQVKEKEWNTFRRFLMQRFPVSKMVSVSSASELIIKGGGTTYEKSSTKKHLEELEDPEKVTESAKVITRQEYVSRLHELKEEILRAWNSGDRVTTLKLSIKVVRLLLDTSVSQFYGTVFVLATDVMDMLGDMVWERIKQKAEFSDDGTKLYSLPENFKPSDVCSDAKETCYNWFCKIGAIRELLPRIYLELAILPCRRFLDDRPEDCLQRLVLMIRGIADPLASAYCRLYLARCMWKLPSYDIVHLVRSVNDIKTSLSRTVSTKRAAEAYINDSKSSIVSLMEPTIEFSMKCIFKGASEKGRVSKILIELGFGRNEEELFGNYPCISVVLHHLLKELPTEIVSSSAVKICHLIECSDDYSFNQCLNYRLLGFRLYENKSQTENISVVVDKVIKVVTQYDSFDEYLKVVDAFVDIILENQMDSHLDIILEEISKWACIKGTAEDEQESLQSILVKLLSHHKHIEDMFALNHFLEILDVMYGSSRTIVNMHILNMATRNHYICDPTTIRLLFEISQALYDSMDFVNVKDADNQPARLISRFVNMVNYGQEMERHLTFLVECREAFGGINGLKEILIHSSNCLVVKALKCDNKQNSFIKSCIAFCEVTIPSISTQISQLNLYLGTAEVSLLGGFVSHSEGLINSAISCLQSLEMIDGSKMPRDVDGILSSICKLCGLLVMVPGNPELGATQFLKTISSIISSQSWLKPKMRAKVFCSVVSLLATLSQNKLPYHADQPKVLGNDYLFYGDSSYAHELTSFSKLVLENLVDSIQQEPSSAARGSLALEACNCIATSFNPSPEISLICAKLMETAKICLSTRDRYLQLTVKFLGKRMPVSWAAPRIAA